MKILIIRLGALGDVIMTTPLIQAIKQHSDLFQIDYLVGKSYAKALETNPHIKQLISVDESIFHNKDPLAILSLAHKLHKKKYDLVITLDKHYLFSVFSWLINAPNRYGFSRSIRNQRLTSFVYFKGDQHERWYYNEIGKLMGVLTTGIKPNVYPSKKDMLFADSIANKGHRLVGLAPGGCVNKGQRLLQKRWPFKHYKTLITLLNNGGFKPVLFGDHNDLHYNKQFVGCINLTSKLTIQKSSALMDVCPVLVMHDSGPLHIASTTKSHIVALFGPTPAYRFGPGENSTILSCQVDQSLKCSPCYDQQGNFTNCGHLDCMNMLTPYEVMRTIKESFK